MHAQTIQNVNVQRTLCSFNQDVFFPVSVLCHIFSVFHTWVQEEIATTSRFEVHGKKLRNASAITQLPIRTSHFQNSPVPYFINLLNDWFLVM